MKCPPRITRKSAAGFLDKGDRNMTVDDEKARRWMKTERTYLRKAAEREAQTGMADFHRKGMDDYLRGKEKAHLGCATGALSYFSGCFGVQGCQTGVAISDPQHPLLASPLAKRRTVPEIPMMDELREVIRKVGQEFPL